MREFFIEGKDAAIARAEAMQHSTPTIDCEVDSPAAEERREIASSSDGPQHFQTVEQQEIYVEQQEIYEVSQAVRKEAEEL